jgi:hypothetical protein
LVLAVAVLLSGGVPPRVCHAHADGDRPHRHDDKTGRHTHDDEDCTVTDAVPHVHLSFFGFEMTLPISDRHDGDDRNQQDREFTLVAIAPAGAAVMALNSHLLRCLSLLPPALPTAHCSAADEQNHLVMSSEDCSIPLCDSARRERSGVLVV